MRTYKVRRRIAVSLTTYAFVIAAGCSIGSRTANAQATQTGATSTAPSPADMSTSTQPAPAGAATTTPPPAGVETSTPAPAGVEHATPPAPAVVVAHSTAPAGAAAAPPAPAPKPPPYSLPWQLRPVAPATVLRLDSSYSFYENPTSKKDGSALFTSLLGSYKIIPDLALIARVAMVVNSAPDPAKGATSFLNPVLAGLYGIKLSPRFKLGLFLGMTLPIGSGGGTTPDAGRAAANGVGVFTRSAFDNALFAVDYFTVFPGVDVAYVFGGLTVQAEATLLKLTKVRGPDAEDDSRVNFTTGVHVGYFLVPALSLGAELRHQRWLSTPTPVKNDATGSLRDTTTVAFGPRFHVKLSDKIWFRPGVSLTLPIDDPMKRNDYKVVQLDLPISF